MNYKKVLKILAWIAFGTQVLAAFILVVILINQDSVRRLMGITIGEGIVAIPWTLVLTIFEQLCFAILLVVAVYKAKGRALRIWGIVIAAAMFLNSISSVGQAVIINVITAGKGSMQLAAASTISTATSVAVNPFISAGTFLILFACGICVCVRE